MLFDSAPERRYVHWNALSSRDILQHLSYCIVCITQKCRRALHTRVSLPAAYCFYPTSRAHAINHLNRSIIPKPCYDRAQNYSIVVPILNSSRMWEKSRKALAVCVNDTSDVRLWYVKLHADSQHSTFSQHRHDLTSSNFAGWRKWAS